MLTYPLHIAFSGYTIIGLTLLVLAASMAGYLLRLRSKSQATWSLSVFFLLVALSGGTTILANAFLHWDRLFTPWQDFWILAAGVALTRFAYSLPKVERSTESRAVLGLMSGLTLIALVYCLIFSYRFLFSWTPGLGVSDPYYLLLPVGILLVVLTFLRRSASLSAQQVSDTSEIVSGKLWRYLIHPQGNDAKAFRSLALALSLAFLPALQTLFAFPNLFGFILSNIGSILAIIAIALVYFNYAPEIHSFMAKLVGITLSTVLLIVAVFSAVEIYLAQEGFSTDRQRNTAVIYDVLVRTGDLPVDLFEVAYVVSWDASKPKDAARYRLLYDNTQEVVFDLGTLIDENQKGYLDTWSQPIRGQIFQLTNQDWRLMRRYWTYPLGSSSEDYWGYIFVLGDLAYEIGFSALAAVDQLSMIVSRWLFLILASSAFILLVFPLFFRRTLVEPLENLLYGVRQVNQGKLDTDVSVRFNDEIGFLTQSFNKMVRSLKELTHLLENRALELEATISDRTIELVKANVQLEKEIKERGNAESLLNQQLLYQHALAGCSQSLLVPAENESAQWEVLTQALEYLRSGAQASRTYIFRSFEDPELGACIGMQAEVLDAGIPAHINVPANQKFPLSSLPTDFMQALSEGRPYGGPVERVFASTPELKEAFLTQNPPLLSVLLFPVFDRDQLWGFIGFDDCTTEREWGQWEIGMLGTAAEMVGNTLQRWTTENQLRETLDVLEMRIEERTADLSESNRLLNLEIGERRRVQQDLVDRLQIEEYLATISARLLEPTGIRDNIMASLEDLGEIMNASRVFLVEFESQTINRVREFYNWHSLEVQPLSGEQIQGFVESSTWDQRQLQLGETIYIEDFTKIPPEAEMDLKALQKRGVQSLILSPLIVDRSLRGVLGCSNFQVSNKNVEVNLRAFELVAGMLRSLLQREYLIQTLEEQVAERTRQLTTFLDMTMLSDQEQDLADVLQPSMAAITEIAHCDACSIHIITDTADSLHLVAQRGIPKEFMQPLSEVEVDQAFIQWLQNEDHYQTTGDPGEWPIFPEQFCFPGYRAFFATRLSAGNISQGLLSCYRAADQPFTPFQATILSALGELLGIIVENHRLRIEAEELAALEERQRLAREIHDAVSQSVYSLSLFARSANDALSANDTQKLSNNLQDLEATALQAMREMRLLLYQLRTPEVDVGLPAALEARFNQVERRLGIQAASEVETQIDLPIRIRHEVWRIITEALNNALKHANADRVDVKMTLAEGNLLVTIQDNGIGIDGSRVGLGMGLKNMRARADALSGLLEFISSVGEGTQVRLQVPLTDMDSQ